MSSKREEAVGLTGGVSRSGEVDFGDSNLATVELDL